MPNRMAIRATTAAMTHPRCMPTRRRYQDKLACREQSQNVGAGIGGNGGNDNYAEGGDVDFKATIESANLNDVLNDSEHFHVDDFVHV